MAMNKFEREYLKSKFEQKWKVAIDIGFVPLSADAVRVLAEWFYAGGAYDFKYMKRKKDVKS